MFVVMPRRLPWVLTVGFAAGGTVGSPARAAEPERPQAKIVVAPFVIDGELSEEAVARIEADLLAGLDRAGLAAVPPGEVDSGGAALPCGDDVECVATVVAANAGTHLLQVEIAQTGRDYEATLSLRAGRDGEEQARSRQECEICGLKELGELIGDQAAALSPKLEAQPATLAVKTKPPGAEVRVDGRLIGVSPIVEPLPPGKHEVTISKRGFVERKRSITSVAGGEESIDLELQAVPTPIEVDSGPDGRGMRIAGWVALGTGLGILGGGVTALVLDERPVKNRCADPANIDINGLCLYRYDTLAAGIGLTAAGGAAAIAGAVLVGLGYKRKKASDKPPVVSVLPVPGGLLLRF